MKPFTYERAKTPAEAAAIVAGRPGAKFIAGGTNLLDLMKLEIETPTHLVDVQDLKLDRIEATRDGGLRIGANVTNTALASDDRVRRNYAVLTKAIVAGASGQLRNKASTDARISTTPTSPATSASRGPAVPRSAAIRVSSLLSVRPTPASPPSPATWRSRSGSSMQRWKR